ncbi:receptor-type tyrosine-protein phosphatase S isoform X2 [Hydra vulgaris]|uniref:receptor-type tyrosine-protein phosphatase S isoform X2 n=1 Tax=Hydra vulgaris TaxID=6087 RepID=UPI001F5E7D41|nr:receptor-type tyrosine-protein phosphatase S isoform X2 [Hydra vulgaris]
MISFEKITTVNGIALQGSETGKSFIKKFFFSYSLTEYGDFVNGQIFDGVDIGYDLVYRWFLYPINVLRVKISPFELGPSNLACLRIELFGCLNNALEEIGMESQIISDSQISLSKSSIGVSARMNYGSSSFYSNYDIDQYIQIDLIHVMSISGVAMKGSVKSYLVYLGSKENLDKELVGEYPGNPDIPGYKPVFSNLNTSKVGSQIKIVRKAVSNNNDSTYIAIEIYGKRLICGDVLIPVFAEMSSAVKFTIMDAYIDSPFTWCALSNDSKPYIIIELNQVFAISGINVQGDSNSDLWVTEYRISYGLVKYKMKDDVKAYIGSKGRVFPYTINWFPSLYFAKYIKVMPKFWINNCCMRIHVRGCTNSLDAPIQINISEENKKLVLRWRKPDIPIPILKYNISLQSFKPYNSSFLFLKSDETVNTSMAIDVEFHAAIFNISVDIVYDKDYFVRKSIQYYSKPISPPTPTYKVLKYFDNYTEVFECQFYSVSDINGPVRFYEIIIAYENISSQNMETLTLKDQSTAESLNLPYFLAAKLPNNFNFNSLKFYEGKERVDSLNASLSTIRNLFLYIRAVINMKDNTFSNLTYYSNAIMFTINRNTLPLNVLNWGRNNEHIIELKKGPSNTMVYEVVAMKVNINTVVRNVTSSYKHFKVYSTADYNEPYIAASFNTSMYEKYKYFVLGNNETFSVEKFEGFQVSNDQNNTYQYLNGKLIAGQTYTLFQRNILDNGRIYTSPWLPEFIAYSNFTPLTEKSSTRLYLFGLILIPVLIVSLIAFLKMRRKLCNDNLKQSRVIHNTNNEDTMHEYQEISLKNDTSYITLQTVLKWPPVSVNEFVAYYLNVKKNDYKDLVTQYESVSKNNIYPHTEATKYPHKNRYANIVPYDHSLVKLVPDFTNYENTYINANYIPSYSKKVTYIATQAPKNETIDDFWRMIFHEKPKAVIMLTNLIENDKIKSAQYWPESDKEYCGLNVCITKTENFADYIIRYISLNFKEVNHHFIHMQFTSWLDNGCPEYPTMLLNFCHRFRCLVPYSDKSLTVVHCSGGVGRTGVFILLDEMLQLIKSEQKVDIFNYFDTIRQNRMQMVQSKEQYIFVYDAIYEAVTCGQTCISISNFQTIVNNLLKKDFSSGKKLIEDEFKMLQNFSLVKGSNEMAIKDKNLQRNKCPQIIPGGNVLVASELYPNAVFVDSYKRKKAFIATQCPLQSTVTEFWYILKKLNVSTIVYLTSRHEKKKKSHYKFYPSDSDLKLNGVTVKLLAEEKLEFVIKRNLSVSVESETIMCMLEFSFWTDNCLPSNDLILQLITEVSKSQQYLRNDIIAVVCNNVLYRSGIFISCFNAIEQLHIEGLVDIFQVVRRAQLSHPSFVQTLPQYEFVYKLIKHYLETFSDYSNLT